LPAAYYLKDSCALAGDKIVGGETRRLRNSARRSFAWPVGKLGTDGTFPVFGAAQPIKTW